MTEETLREVGTREYEPKAKWWVSEVFDLPGSGVLERGTQIGLGETQEDLIACAIKQAGKPILQGRITKAQLDEYCQPNARIGKPMTADRGTRIKEGAPTRVHDNMHSLRENIERVLTFDQKLACVAPTFDSDSDWGNRREGGTKAAA